MPAKTKEALSDAESHRLSLEEKIAFLEAENKRLHNEIKSLKHSLIKLITEYEKDSVYRSWFRIATFLNTILIIILTSVEILNYIK